MLPFLEPPLNCVNMFAQAAISDYVVRNVPIPALAPDASLPQHGKAKDVLCDQLHTSLHETEELIAANPLFDCDKMKHQRPLFGVQTAPQLLPTLWLHEQAHQDQISRVVASARFPKAA